MLVQLRAMEEDICNKKIYSRKKISLKGSLDKIFYEIQFSI